MWQLGLVLPLTCAFPALLLHVLCDVSFSSYMHQAPTKQHDTNTAPVRSTFVPASCQSTACLLRRLPLGRQTSCLPLSERLFLYMVLSAVWSTASIMCPTKQGCFGLTSAVSGCMLPLTAYCFIHQKAQGNVMVLSWPAAVFLLLRSLRWRPRPLGSSAKALQGVNRTLPQSS